MAALPFRFIQSSDFRLERSVQGLAEVPEHLRDSIIQAPSRAVASVFDAALDEEVDFVILCGDLVDLAMAGAGELVFLLDQFHRLAEREIAVYWAGGSVDPPSAWPRSLALPESVHVFAAGRPETHFPTRGGEPLSRIAGAGRQRGARTRFSQLATANRELFRIAAVHASAEAANLQKLEADYWALGARADRCTLSTSPMVAHYAGSPQARNFDETGAHGCTLVQVDENGRARTSLIATDSVRFASETFCIDGDSDRGWLEDQLRQRMTRIAQGAGERVTLVRWSLQGDGPLARALQHGSLASEITAWLRTEFGHQQPSVWTVELRVCPPEITSELLEQETILGDFLRAVAHYENNESEPINLEHYLSQKHLAGSVAAEVALDEPATRQRVLQEVARLGVDLLGGSEGAGV